MVYSTLTYVMLMSTKKIAPQAASYLLQIKWLITNQPFGADVRFDTLT